MRTNTLWRITSVVMLLAMLISPLGATGSVAAAPSAERPAPGSGPQVISASHVGVTKPLSELAISAAARPVSSAPQNVPDRRDIPKTASQADGGFDASFVQGAPVANNMPAAVANFEGINNVNGVLPPDTNGDVGTDPATGTKYYMQWVNLSLQIWDVTNPAAPVSQLAAPLAGNVLWTGSGSLCEANNDGDPIVLFDHLANRWMISQFALGFPNDFHQCIAVSASGDPTGTWYTYDFQTSTTVMNDYPHFGVWPDGYYMTVNQFDGTSSAWAGGGVAVFERTAMLAGLSARMIYIDTGLVTLNYGGMLPSDLDGPAPAAGTPNYFSEWDDSTWLGDAADTLRIWEFKTDWVTPANTTFGLNANYDPNIKISTANVDPSMCGGARSCIPQPGTAAGLDAIADRLMHRLQFRNFGGYQTLVGNHTVDATSADKAGIHWFELRNTGGAGWAMNQEGVYAPDAENRWMASAAMDGSGDIAIGFSVSSSTVSPSIRYAGRLAGDPAGQLSQGEATLIAGTGAQTHSAARWGDYSMLSVDPADDCTYWYTTEYTGSVSSASWQTRVGSFKFPSCTSAPTGTLQGTVTNSSAAPLAGASVDLVGGYHTVTDATGHYEFALAAGTYDATASKYGYVDGAAAGLVVTVGNTTTQNFSLTAAPTSTISGVVSDTAAGWPLYARIDITGFPGGPVFTNPTTGAYSVPLINGSYTFTVTSLIPGYTAAIQPMTVSANATQNFGMTVDSLTCSAPGYHVVPGATLYTENFDSVVAPALPANWSKVDVSVATAGDWITRTVGVHPAGTVVHSAPNMAVFNSWTASAGNSTRLFATLGQDLSAQTSAEVSFWMYHDTAYTVADSIQVQVSTDAGATWNNAGLPVSRHDGSVMWKKHTVNIDAYSGAGMTDVRIGLLALSQWGSDIHVDDVTIGTATQCLPNASTGLVLGTVVDALTGDSLPGAVVTDAVPTQALVINNTADAGQLHPFYLLAEPAGAVSLTASAFKYASSTQSPTVVSAGVVRQDFSLTSGKLSANPTSLSFGVTTAAPATLRNLALNNIGGAAASYNVFAVDGAWAGYTPTGPFAANTRHTGPKNLNDLDASKLRINFTPQNVPEINGGAIVSTWNSGLLSPWGLGFNTDANDLWIGNILAGGGDDLNHRFTTAGVNTGDTIDTAPWVGVFGGDMAYNTLTKSLWQVNVGGDNCIYEMDPATKASTGNKICPAFGTSERGLAFDPSTNTYYAGSWNDGIVNRFAPDGTLLAAVDTGLSIAGLAFNPSTQHLFVIVSSDGSYPDVYVLDAATTNYDIVGAFYLKNGAEKVYATTFGGQAGLEIDCGGNLWSVNQNTGEIYQAATGETGVCDWQASWLSVVPDTGSVAGSASTTVKVIADATGLAVGTYTGYLRISSDTPHADTIVPVTMTVTASPIFADVATSHWANSWIEGLYNAGITSGCSVSPLNYCPDQYVTRAQMAIFLLRSKHGGDYVPPAATGTVFTDVSAGSFAAAWIEQLAAEGITSGCSATTYCPNDTVTRAQMAILLLRASEPAGFTPPAATGTVFTDVSAGSFAAAWIEELKAQGITSGCTATTYCPGSAVTRAQMAVFLNKAFGLP